MIGRNSLLRITLILFVLLLVIVLPQPFFQPPKDFVRNVVAFPVKISTAGAAKVSQFFRIIFSLNELSGENARLREENNQLRAEIESLKATETENQLLKRELNFKQNTNFNLLPAQVLQYSPSGIFQSLTIDKGSEDGLAEAQPVVSQGYLVGRVGSVSKRTAEVLLITNRGLKTPVSLSSNGVVGLLIGGIRGLVVENIPLDTPVKQGDGVVTSSLEGLYPSGIAVGEVAEVISSKEDIFLTLRITTPLNLSALTRVFVITNK